MKNRNIVLCVVLSLVTCGIYGIYWLYQIITAMPQVTGFNPVTGNPVLEVVLCCTPYTIFWNFKAGESFDNAGKPGLVAGSNKIIFLVLSLVGLGIVNYCVMQNEINKLAD